MPYALRSALLLWVSLLLTAPVAWAQRTAGYGDWQLHTPTNRARVLADTGPRIFVAAEDAFYSFDKATSSIQRLSRRDGLNDVDVRALAYDSLTQQLVVVYRSGTIDLLNPSGEVLATLSDVQRKTVTGAKVINSVSVGRRLAFLNTSFGIVVVDLQRREIRDTYVNFGPGGAAPQTYATAVLGDTLYAATSAGLLRGRLTTNLLDYTNWRGTTGFGARTNDPYRLLVTHQGKVYAGIQGDNVYRAVGAGWVALPFNGADLRSLRSTAAGLLVTEGARLSLFDARTNAVRRRIQDNRLPQPQDAIRANSGPIFAADYTYGLVRVGADGSGAESFVANGPGSVSVFNINTDAASKTVTVFSGGYAEGYYQLQRKLGFYVFDADGRWDNVTSANYSAADFPNFEDLSRGARTPDGTLYIGSYNYGLLEWKGPGQWRQLTQGTAGVPLLSAIPANPNYTRITDVATDANGNVWVNNRHQIAGRSGTFRFSPTTNEWQAVPYFVGAERPERLAIDALNHPWIGLDRRGSGGLVTYNSETAAIRSFDMNSGLPSTTIWDLARDRNGAIWAATGAGVAVYDDPSLAFDPSAPGFRTPIIRRGEGTGFQALYSETVKCVAVDGGNRKWFGTDRGLWLFNADCDEALLHFTTENSPLPSDKIVDVAVDDRTGEVWVGTEAGLVSYRGSATVTEGTPSAKTCAKVFPNPVRQDFAGQVGISGLANNAEVKITDITGTLVYQTRATGGTVVWNLADYNGRRVQSGVYLVLTADADGKNGCISKVAVLTK